MLFVRPVALSDHDELLALAREAGVGMTSLPADPQVLQAKIERSVQSFAGTMEALDESFLLVLVDMQRNKLVGTCGLVAHVGLKRPFYSYKLSTIVQACGFLDIYSLQRVLHMVNDYTGATEIGSLFLLPEYRTGGIGSLLSRCRYLMLAEFPELFSDTVIAEIRGVQDEQGDSPFYKNLAQHFFQMEFKDADFINATKGGQFISDLMPKYPIYVNLLDSRAQDVIGKPFSGSRPAMQLLQQEGFEYQGYIDVFDGGPTMQAERSRIRTVRKSARAPMRSTGETEEGPLRMLATTEFGHFRIAFTQIKETPSGLVIPQWAAEALHAKPGTVLRYH